MFDVLIIGGGVSGMSCALILGSAHNKAYASDKKIGIITHQKASSLQDGLYNNVYGIAPGKLGSELLSESISHLAEMYPHVMQIPNEKVLRIDGNFPDFIVVTNKGNYQTREVVIGIGSSNTFDIAGLMDYVEPHKKAMPEKNRIQLRNADHKVANGIYVIGNPCRMEKPAAHCFGKRRRSCNRHPDRVEQQHAKPGSRQYPKINSYLIFIKDCFQHRVML